MVVLLALIAAAVAGGGAVCQQRAAAEVPLEHSLRLGLLWALLRRPVWLAGVLSDVVAFGFQAAALAHGSLVLVQPLLSMGLLFALGIGAAWSRQPLRRVEWVCALMVTSGLAAFLIAADPNGGTAHAAGGAWLRCIVAVAAVVGICVLGATRLAPRGRTALLALAAGVAVAFMAVMAKALSDAFSHHGLHALASWPPYAVVVSGITALLLIQSAYQSGPPTISLPIITVVDPVVSGLIGVYLLHEHLGLAGRAGALAVLAVGVSAVGIVGLGRSETVTTQMVGAKAGGPTR